MVVRHVSATIISYTLMLICKTKNSRDLLLFYSFINLNHFNGKYLGTIAVGGFPLSQASFLKRP